MVGTMPLALCAVLLLVTTGCEWLWPRCASQADCPEHYDCNSAGRCQRRHDGVDILPDAAVSSSSSAATTSGVASSALSSSSGPFNCLAYNNTQPNRAVSFVLEQPFDAPYCRDGDNPTYHWRLQGSLRAGARVELAVERLTRDDAGVPAYPVVYDVHAIPWNGEWPQGPAVGNPERIVDSNSGDLNLFSSEVYVRAQQPAPLTDELQFIQQARITLRALSPCAVSPTNTQPDQATWNFWISGGPICRAGETYFWKYNCPMEACMTRVEIRDGPMTRTPLEVLAGPYSDGGLLPCIPMDGGFTCEGVPRAASGSTLIAVRAAVDGGTTPVALPQSEYVVLVLSGWDGGVPPPDGG